MRALVVAVAVAGMGVAACARPGAPPGGPADLRPPVVLSVEPDTFAIVEPGRRTLKVKFNERISESPIRGTLDGAVRVSPAGGEVQVEHQRDGIEITLLEGFQPGRVYAVTIDPVLEDMFGNPMAVPFEWVFSTGADFQKNALVGAAWDAITGLPVEGARIQVRPLAADGQPQDSFPWVAVADSAGVFSLRYLPAGPLDVLAYLDQNGNDQADLLEPRYASRTQIGATDTIFIANAALLPGDTTPARLLRAEVLDSVTLRMIFDDFLDPLAPIAEVSTTLEVPADSLLPDSLPGVDLSGVAVPEVTRAFHEYEFADWLDSLAEARSQAQQAAADAAAATDPDPVAADPDTTLAHPDTTPPVPDSTLADPEGAAAAGPLAARSVRAAGPLPGAQELLPDGRPKPQTSYVVRLAQPLPFEIPFAVESGGVINIAQRPGGLGTAVVIRAAPPPPDSSGVGGPDLATDTLDVVDTVGVFPGRLLRR